MIWELVLLGIIAVLAVLLAIVYGKYKGALSEKEVLEEIVRVKDKTIENYKKVRGNIVESEDETVMKYADEGMEVDEIARKLDMPTSKVEMILRFAQIKAKKSE
jgi:DNA-directed RNA polymerase specialized sigma24 family protein